MKPDPGPYDVCIVSSGCVSSGPRVEKEADALAAAGYRVAVLATHSLDWMASWDERLAEGKAWHLHGLDFRRVTRRRTPRYLVAAATQRAARGLCSALPVAPGLLSAIAGDDRSLALAHRASTLRARLYVAHNPAALPAAMIAARVRRVPFAFDAEDDHFGELSVARQQGLDGRIMAGMLHACLPGASYVTAASDGIGAALAQRYGIRHPVTVLNVFPLALRQTLDGQRMDRQSSAALSVYWYSQTLGLDRGLQDAIVALGQVRGLFELHLRGSAAPSVEAALRALARTHGVEALLRFHPQVHPSELLSRTAEHDVGLALEQPVSDNRLIAVTNKVFFYMLAGLAIVATDTPGQRAIANQTGDAFELYTPGDAPALARCLQRLHDDRALLVARRQRLLELASTRYHAEAELQKLPPLVAAALGSA